MNFLNNLSFVSIGNGYSVVERRRIKMVERLREQLTLIDQTPIQEIGHKPIQEIDQTSIQRTQRNRIIDPVTNEVTFLEKSVPVKPWWKTSPDGQIILTIKHGMRKVEFQKGKSGILVSSMDELPALLQSLIDATIAGDLDRFMDGAADPDTIATPASPETSKRSLSAKKGR